jgi:chitodextrinase
VYFVRGEVNGRTVNLEAGINSYYMFTEYARDTASAMQFRGSLRQRDCPNGCEETFEVSLRDYQKNGAVFVPDSVLKKGMRPFFESDQFIWVQYISIFNKQVASVHWDFGDGSTSANLNPIHKYLAPAYYNVCLTEGSSNGCSGSVCNRESIRPGKSSVGIQAASTSPRTVAFSQVANGTAPFEQLWDFGDGTFSNGAAPVHVYSVEGSYPVKLRIIDANKDTAYATYNAVTIGDKSSCASNYTVLNTRPETNPGISEITLTWKESGGRVYSTNGIQQPADSYFEILETEEAGVNEKGEPIARVHARIKAVVSDGVSQKTIRADVAFAVAHP